MDEFDYKEAYEDGVKDCAAGPWIPVSERLPDESELVLGYWSDLGHCFEAKVDKGYWKYWVPRDSDYWVCLPPTHWASLNAPEVS